MRSIFNISVLLLVISSLAFGQVQITNTNIYYTADQMLLANEINESGEPFAEALGYNLDDLDPFILNQPDSISYTLGIENYEYSRYQLGTIISRSGMGLHMMWAPIIVQKAAMEPSGFDGSFTGTANGFNEDDELVKNIMHFSMLSNHAPPGHPWPQFAEFISGDPHLPQPIDPQNFAWNDFSTLRWDRSKMDKTLNPAAMGHALTKQYLWAQDMLSAYHDSLDNGIDPAPGVSPDSSNGSFDPSNNIYFGGDALDGFVGQILTAEAINKVKFLISTLAYNGNSLTSVDPATYNPANGILYFPHLIAVTESQVGPNLPPKGTGFTVTDAGSDLWDQIAFLWGTLSFADMMDPNNSSSPAHLAYHQVFDGDPFPASMAQTGAPGPFDLMKGTSKVIFLNLMNMHYVGSEGTFVNRSELVGGAVQRGNEISTVNAGYTLVILKLFFEEFTGTPLDSTALKALKAQADFLTTKLYDQNGRFYNSYMIGSGAVLSSTTVENQAAAIRGLYAAYQATNDNKYLQAANAGYQYLLDKFYVSSQHAFFTEEGNNTATYTPLNVATISGALREAALVGGQSDAPAIYARFFKKVVNSMQLSEGANTGESGGDSDGDGIPYIPEQPDNLPPVFATEATLNLGVTGFKEQRDNIISTFQLEQNYPNPFNPTTTIVFRIQRKGHYELSLYNVAGEKLRTLISGELAAKEYTYQFNGAGRPSGIYYYELKGEGSRITRKLILMK